MNNVTPEDVRDHWRNFTDNGRHLFALLFAGNQVQKAALSAALGMSCSGVAAHISRRIGRGWIEGREGQSWYRLRDHLRPIVGALLGQPHSH